MSGIKQWQKLPEISDPYETDTKIMLPYLQCRVIEEVCRREGVQIQWYEVKSFEKPYQGKYPEEDVFYISSITMDS